MYIVHIHSKCVTDILGFDVSLFLLVFVSFNPIWPKKQIWRGKWSVNLWNDIIYSYYLFLCSMQRAFEWLTIKNSLYIETSLKFFLQTMASWISILVSSCLFKINPSRSEPIWVDLSRFELIWVDLSRSKLLRVAPSQFESIYVYVCHNLWTLWENNYNA